MKGWIKQLAGTIVVLAVAAAALVQQPPLATPTSYVAEVTWGSAYAAGVLTYTSVTYYVATTDPVFFRTLLSEDGSANGGWAVTPVPNIPLGWNLICARDQHTTAWATQAPGYRQAAHQFCDGTFAPGQSP